MVGKFKLLALTGALMMAGSPVFAAEMVDVPVIGQVDLDPLNLATIIPGAAPAPAAAPAAAPAKAHRHRMHHKMHKKMMHKKKG